MLKSVRQASLVEPKIELQSQSGVSGAPLQKAVLKFLALISVTTKRLKERKTFIAEV